MVTATVAPANTGPAPSVQADRRRRLV